MVSQDISERLRRLEIPGRVTIIEGNGELPKIEVVTNWGTAEVYFHGAHVTDFHKHGDAPLLFTSQCSRFAEAQAIRGGIPIIFPWFGGREGLPAHGFARITDWELNEATAVPDGGVSLRFGLGESPLGATCPGFTANYVVTCTDRLELELIVTNNSAEQPLTFENCLHSYFAVSDVESVSVHGLQGTTYLDQVENFARKTESQEAIRIASEFDRIYLDTQAAVELVDPGLKRRIRIEKRGSASTVVWNPWIAKAQQMPDFCNEDYRVMLCVESGNVADNKLILPPARSAVLNVTLSSSPL
jgi:glucose-6-phosphate 1-epimerase